MRKIFKFAIFGLGVCITLSTSGCSKDENEPDETKTVTIGFSNVSANLFGGPTAQGTNLYLGSDYEIQKGYIAPIAFGKYAQFSINYGEGYSADYGVFGWGYSITNGGLALSNWHDMTDGTYLNQLSVYSESSPSGGNFVVATGYSNLASENPMENKYSQYADCAKIYITDAEGYGVSKIGEEAIVNGEDEDAYFKSVYINNTTYPFLVMKNGNAFSSPLNEENKGWFKVQFIAFNDDDANEKPLSYKEVYLANFDPSLADGYIGIIDEWIKVDLSTLPECSIIVINFVGSDKSYGYLNTPAYCALDQFEISVKD